MQRKEIYFSDLFDQLDVLLAYAESEGNDSRRTHAALTCFTNKMLDYMEQERRSIIAKFESDLDAFEELSA